MIIRSHRSRASAQAGFISPLCPGQHWRLRPFRLLAAAAGFLCKKVAPGQHRREAPIVFARVVQQKRHDVENVASAGANPAASTTFLELKPQQTGTGLLIRYGEVATTSGSTNFLPGRLISRTPPFEGGRAGASPAPAANFHSPLAQNKSGSLTN